MQRELKSTLCSLAQWCGIYHVTRPIYHVVNFKAYHVTWLTSARDWIGKEFWPFTCGKKRLSEEWWGRDFSMDRPRFSKCSNNLSTGDCFTTFQTQRRELKVRLTAEYFWRILVSDIQCTLSFETKIKEKTEK